MESLSEGSCLCGCDGRGVPCSLESRALEGLLRGGLKCNCPACTAFDTGDSFVLRASATRQAAVVPSVQTGRTSVRTVLRGRTGPHAFGRARCSPGKISFPLRASCHSRPRSGLPRDFHPMEVSGTLPPDYEVQLFPSLACYNRTVSEATWVSVAMVTIAGKRGS